MTRIAEPVDSRYRCSFCGKPQSAVGVLLICAPASICDACVADFQKIVDTWRDKRGGARIIDKDDRR